MNMPQGRNRGLWFRTVKACSTPRVRLVCFPHAGGAASFFRDWAPFVPDGVELLAVRYPGREDRLHDSLPDSLEELAHSVAQACRPFIDAPLALFGHSMGASIAYETAMRLRERPAPPLAGLFLSSRSGPGQAPQPALPEATDTELLQHIESLGGTHAQVLRDPELLELILPAIRSDYHLVSRYQNTVGPNKLQVPVTAYYGTEDTRAGEAAVARWSAVTSSSFTVRGFAGGHFYLMGHRRELIMDISSRLRTLIAPHHPGMAHGNAGTVEHIPA
ncbi:thioesterase II family protein [Streptomyces erythrochromogenes]|uniref:thioesterase II family protein n=1 Tax=Streptomyces erythrochromogenes TaxID=285574 RepID=UPI0022593482|nr:alpha/beta fold hydrolase [Streptomyces erythrochromogenes]MCX5586263.1 alpha/beta fold hydrolase [Streptomyces erythrochromogenes]